jgi:hypothetical protein
MTGKKSTNIRLFKSKELSKPSDETLKIIIHFVTFAANKLGIDDKPIIIRLLHASPNEPITTGAYQPSNDVISVIVENRHLIDYARTIAHEMTHQKQDYEGRVDGPVQEIGGDIEDEANAVSGQIMKEYIKKQLTPEQKKFLGLGSY